MLNRPVLTIGNLAGHNFRGQADLHVAYHATCGDRKGYLMKRKRLRDRAAYEYDPRLGWENDVWFEWEDSDAGE